MLISLSPVSSAPISSRITFAFSASISITQPASSISITDQEKISGSLALVQGVSTFSLAGVTFTGSLALTQQASSINLNEYNALEPWVAPAEENSPIRQFEPSLKQLRQVQPMLQE